jgi:branched-chain amino acid transport system permease protein
MTTAAIDRTGRWDLDALRRRLSFLAPLAGLLVVQQLLYPAPKGIVLNGALVGGRIALIALGIALIYRANRIVNCPG